MKIRSSFQDYYDATAQRLDPDPTPFWNRESRFVRPRAAGGSNYGGLLVSTFAGEMHKRSRWAEPYSVLYDLHCSLPDVASNRWGRPVMDIRAHVVVFGGRVFPVYVVPRVGVWHGPQAFVEAAQSGDLAAKIAAAEASLGPLDVVAFGGIARSLDPDGALPPRGPELSGWIQKRIEPLFGLSKWLPSGKKARGFASLDPKTAEASARWFADHGTVPEQIHAELGSPVLRVGPEAEGAARLGVECDAKVGDLGLASVLPPTEAWQLLDRVFNGVMSNTPEVPCTTGGDDIVRDAKGFDKWSFRRHRDDPR